MEGRGGSWPDRSRGSSPVVPPLGHAQWRADMGHGRIGNPAYSHFGKLLFYGAQGHPLPAFHAEADVAVDKLPNTTRTLVAQQFAAAMQFLPH